MYCIKCGNEIAEGSLFCTKCGTKIEEAAVNKNIQVKQDPQPVRSKKPLLIVGIALLVSIVLIVGGCVIWNKTFDIRYQKKMETYISKENYDKAENCYQKALDKYPENEIVYLYGADVYMAQDKPRKALKILLKGIEETDSKQLKEKISDVYQEQISTYIRREKYEEAESLYKEMVDLDPENEIVYLYGADVYVAQNNPKKAITILMKGIKETDSKQLKEKKTTIYQEQIATYIREENYDNAEIFYSEMASMDPADENVYLYGADIYVAQDRMTEAITILIQGITETNSEQLKEKKTTIYQEQIAAYIREENYESAKVFYSEVASMDPADENVYLYGADIYLAQGWYTEGVEVLEDGITKTNSKDLAERKTYVGEHKMLSEKLTYDSNGSIYLSEEFDEAGNGIKETRYYSDGSIEAEYEYEYDASGNKTKEIQYDGDGSIWLWVEHEYDVLGNLTKEISYDSDGNIDSSNTYSYIYTYTGTLLSDE